MSRQPFRFRPQVWDLENRYTPAFLTNNLSALTTDVEAAMDDRWLASSFTTGTDAASLRNATLKLANSITGTALVSIYTDDTSAPGSLVGSLSSPSTFSAGLSNTSFNSPGISLAPSTTYWVVLQAVTGEFEWAYTSDNSGNGSGFINSFGSSSNSGSNWLTNQNFPTQMSVTADVGSGNTAGTISFAAATYNGMEGGGTVTISATRTGGSTGAVSVPIALTGNATSGVDYSGVPAMLAFGSGVTTATFTVAIADDANVEGTETATLTLGTPTGSAALGTPTATTLTIDDNDSATGSTGVLAFSSATFNTTEEAGTVSIAVNRTGGSTGSVSVPILVSGGTATAGTDYSGAPTVITLADGVTTATVDLMLLDDSKVEGTETAVITLGMPTGGVTLGPIASVTINIAENDTVSTTPGSIAFSAANFSTVEGGGKIAIALTRTGGNTGAVSVPIAVAGGTATTDTDFTGLPVTVSFANGQSSATFSVTIVDDTGVEGSETATIALGTPTGGATLGSPATATLAIVDNDATTVSFASSMGTVTEAVGSISVSVLRAGNISNRLTVPITATGTATADSDYSGLPTGVTFAAGQTSTTIVLTVRNDTNREGTETIQLGFGTLSSTTLLGTPANTTISILDNESASFSAVAGSSTVSVYNADGTLRTTLAPFELTLDTSIRTATADITGDGNDDLIVAAGPGQAAKVIVYDGSTLATLATFTAFEPTFLGGAFVAAGDIDGDNRADVVITPDRGGGPVVAIYTGATLSSGGTTELIRYFGIEDADFRGGARAGVGDLNNDGFDDVIVSAGFLGGPRISTYNGAALATGTIDRLTGDFFAFENSLRNGAFVAVGDFNNDGFADLAFGGGPSGGPRVRILSGRTILNSGVDSALVLPLANFFAGDSNLRGGVHLGTTDANSDGIADLIVGSGDAEPSRVRVYLSTTILANGSPVPDREFDPFGTSPLDGVFVG